MLNWRAAVVVLLGCSSCSVSLPWSEAGARVGQSYGTNNNAYGRGNGFARQSYGYSSTSYGGHYQPAVKSQYGFSSSGPLARDPSWGSHRGQAWKDPWPSMDKTKTNMDRIVLDRPSEERPSVDRFTIDRFMSNRPGIDKKSPPSIVGQMSGVEVTDPVQRTGAGMANNLRPLSTAASTTPTTTVRPSTITVTTIQPTMTKLPLSSSAESSTTRQNTLAAPPISLAPMAAADPKRTNPTVFNTPPVGAAAVVDLNSDVSDEVDLRKLARKPIAAADAAAVDISDNSLETFSGISLRAGGSSPTTDRQFESLPAVPAAAGASAAAGPSRPALMAVAAVPGLPVLEGDGL